MFTAIALTLGAAFASDAHQRGQRAEAARRAWDVFIANFHAENAEAVQRSDPEVLTQLVDFDRMMEAGELPPGVKFEFSYLRRGFEMFASVGKGELNTTGAHVTLLAKGPANHNRWSSQQEGALRFDLEQMDKVLEQVFEQGLLERGLRFRRSSVWTNYSPESGAMTRGIHYLFTPEWETWTDERGYSVRGVRKAFPKVPRALIDAMKVPLKEALQAQMIHSKRPGWAFIPEPPVKTRIP